MKPLIACENCGKIVKQTRSDRKTCSNGCAVKLIYARKHLFDTAYDSYLKLINEIEIKPRDNISNNYQKNNTPDTALIVAQSDKKITDNQESFLDKEQNIIPLKLIPHSNDDAILVLKDKAKIYHQKFKAL